MSLKQAARTELLETYVDPRINIRRVANQKRNSRIW